MDLVVFFPFSQDRWNSLNIKQVLSLVEKYLSKDPEVRKLVNNAGKRIVSIHILDIQQ